MTTKKQPAVVPPKTSPKVPKVPKDPEERKAYDRARRKSSDERKALSGERRLTTWISSEASASLDKLTGGSKDRGVIQTALEKALIFCADQMPSKGGQR